MMIFIGRDGMTALLCVKGNTRPFFAGGDNMWIIPAFIVCAVIGAYVGERKGQGLIGAALGLFLGPFGLFTICVTKGNRYDCPWCMEWVHEKATVCPHCGRDIKLLETVNQERPEIVKRKS